MFNLIPWKSKESRAGMPARSIEQAVGRLRDEFEGLFDRFFGRLPVPFGGPWADLEDKGKEFVVQVEAPGFEAGDFDVQVTGNLLTIRAEHKEGGKRDGGIFRERYGRFHRSMTLPAGINSDQVEAGYHSGILEVHLPKIREAQGRRIQVKA